ncbi:MAG: hypothetical protein US86_C0001G0188 [Candidatus Daviesbacteria bacterium GW2011_GWA2_38_24]|uniref:Glycosyltransferase RgtA/B/C/D-like domain-containing protein n=1 Tax=Candidatus Daviesbacteria bacterium GW2011_GWA2_38_24 TaxID=1618422 RepID=A0A0G0MQS3_9BACT|nr:MAG: hypothetical protein US86_C0001G0188 [Candidatus Daviesbacteria bacterium GW2011_GWA2_38_24]KKQ80919.1 MAG: hypothetical protein UT01_C0004G0008 [Candidatus Daviesbacteria bacterium GW2011_GWA1_38_7]
MKLNKKLFVILVLIFLGLTIRIFGISDLPLYGDELTLVYDTFSVLKTGQDQTGKFFPVTFPMGAGRPGGYIYFSIPFVAMFGPNALGVRALSLLSGIGIILLVYLLTKKLINAKVAQIAAVLIAISPWSINLSRGGYESHFALFLSLLGLYSYLLAKQKPLMLILSAFFFGFAIHTYPTFKMTLPILVPLFILLVGDAKNTFFKRKLYSLAAASILIFFSLLSLMQTLNFGSETRFQQINIFTSPEFVQKVTERVNKEREFSTARNFIKPFISNKVVEYSFYLIENYTKNLSPEFLFLRGDRNPRHNMSLMGGLYLAELLTVILGSVFLLSKKTNISLVSTSKLLVLLISWILITPLPTSLLPETHFLRNSLMLIPLNILSALGIYSLVSLEKNRVKTFSLFVLFAAVSIQLLFLVYRIFFVSPNEFSRFWSYGAKHASMMVAENIHKFDYFILSDKVDNLEYAYPVYSKISPREVIEQNSQKTKLNGYEFKKFDKVYIGSIPSSKVKVFLENLNGSYFYIGPVEDGWELEPFETINNKDNLPAFIVAKKIK